MRPPNTILRAASARSLPSDAWTVDLIRSAEVSADAGQLRWAAELCDALLGDDRVQAAREHLAGLFGLPLTFEDGAGTARTKKRARRALEAQEDWWEIFPDEALVELLFWGVLLGVGLGELVWTSRRGRWVPRLVVWHPRALRWDTAQGRWMVRLADGSEVAIEPGDGKWVVFTPRSSTRPWVHGAWRAVARWWRAKRYAISDWGKHSEQASGLKVASTTDGTDADRRKLAADLGDAGTDAAVVMPPGWDLKQLAVPSSTVDVFDRLIDAADGAITLTLLGQNLTTEVTEGSRAAASVHATVSAVCLQALAASLSSTLRAQVLERWAFYNFNDPAAAPWPLWDTAPPADRAQDAEVLSKRAAAAVTLADRGAPVDWRALAEEHGVPLAAAPTAPVALSAATATTPAERRALAGQAWVDRLHAASCDSAPTALRAGILGAVGQAVRDATSAADLRARLEALRGTGSPEFRRLMEGAVLGAAAAGAFSSRTGDG